VSSAPKKWWFNYKKGFIICAATDECKYIFSRSNEWVEILFWYCASR